MSSYPQGIAFLSSAPIRLEASDRAELTNVLLFGETFDILEQLPKWVNIRLHHDRYEGWIDRLMIKTVSVDYIEILKGTPKIVVSDPVGMLQGPAPADYPLITQGALLPLCDGGTLRLEDKHYTFEGGTATGVKERTALVDYAFSYLNAPYLWGGKTPMGIDCSGLTQMIYRINGYKIPRDANQQAQLGTTLSFIDESKPGDLAFFDDDEGNIIHVGLLLQNHHILHAHGNVRIDRVDQTGIYNIETQQHSHKLRIIKKVI